MVVKAVVTQVLAGTRADSSAPGPALLLVFGLLLMTSAVVAFLIRERSFEWTRARYERRGRQSMAESYDRTTTRGRLNYHLSFVACVGCFIGGAVLVAVGALSL